LDVGIELVDPFEVPGTTIPLKSRLGRATVKKKRRAFRRGQAYLSISFNKAIVFLLLDFLISVSEEKE
jgi:hypothetical protein